MGIIKLSEEDIILAENILLGNDKFDENEKIPIIKCMDKSINTMACPGSGKTTVLLGKIIGLLNHMPLADGKGVCIITHTNVAINEIKNKLGAKSDILFQYPNFIGTIQSFIDRYLAGPYLKQKYGENIATIDDNFYYKKMFLQKESIEILRKFAYGKKKNEINKETEWKQKNIIKDEYIKSIRVVRKDGKFDFIVGKSSLKLKNPDTPTFKALQELFINSLLEKGILRYSDTYLLAQMYIEEYPIILNYFSERFQYVFMDEIQDNSWIQNDILGKIFYSDKIIVQKFGDLNQAIYENQEENEIDINEKDKPVVNFEISSSMRFPQSIASFIENLRIESATKKLVGNGKDSRLIPHILVYELNGIGKVKDKYIELIKAYKLESEEKIFKCCGWVGYKEEEKLSIKSYFEEFKSNKDKSQKYIGLSFQSLLCENAKTGITVRMIYKTVMECISRILNLKDIEVEGKKSNFTILEKYIINNLPEEYQSLRICIAKQAKGIVLCNQESFNKLGQCAYKLIKVIYTSCKEDGFMKLFELQQSKKCVVGTSINEYKKDGITVLFDTVHGVKGETHTATLYLETYFNKQTDLQRIFRFITDKDAKIKNSDERKALKVGYVGMSRARKLLCIATCKDTFKKYKDKLNKMDEEGIIKIIHI